MRYCRIRTEAGLLYLRVEQRGTDPRDLWATEPLAPMPEDGPAHQAWQAGAAQGFLPASLVELEQRGSLLAPVAPSKIVCVGRNYSEHAAELGNDVPAEPLLFLKPPSALLAPGGIIVYPAVSQRVDFEGELAVVIGARASALAEDADMRPYIRGYCCLNDVTARDLQKSDPQWTRGKGFDTFCPVGPLVSDEVDAVNGSLQLTTRLNGQVKQHGSTKDFIFGIAHLLRYISAVMTLEPGDVIATGTPAGVGPMRAGDTVEVKIEGLGVLRNRVAERD